MNAWPSRALPLVQQPRQMLQSVPDVYRVGTEQRPLGWGHILEGDRSQALISDFRRKSKPLWPFSPSEGLPCLPCDTRWGASPRQPQTLVWTHCDLVECTHYCLPVTHGAPEGQEHILHPTCPTDRPLVVPTYPQQQRNGPRRPRNTPDVLLPGPQPLPRA